MITSKFNPATKSMDIVKDGEVIEAGVSLLETPARLSFHRFEAAKNAPVDDRKALYWQMDGTAVYKRPRTRRA